MGFCNNDNRFQVGSNCRQLDFTLTFEQSILSLLPDILFIVVALHRLRELHLWSTKISRIWTGLYCSKALAGLMLVASSLAALIVHAVTGSVRHTTRTTLPTLIFQLLAVSLLIPLTLVEHTKSLAPSSRIINYTLIKGLFVSAILRTYLLSGTLDAYPRVFHATALVAGSYYIVLFTELVHKRSGYLKDEYKYHPQEAKSSFLVRSMFLWLLPLLWRGRNTRFQLKDLNEIPQDFKAEESRQHLLIALETGNKSSYFYLLHSTINSFGISFFAPILPRFILLLATFGQPLLLKDILGFMSTPTASNSVGWAIFGGYVCIYGLMVISTALFWEKLYAVTVKYRGALVGAIYLKTLKVASHTSRPLGTGVGSNYMSVDVERITLGIESFHELLGAFFSLPLAFAILYSQAHWVAFLPLGIIAIALCATSYAAKLAGTRQTVWSAKTDERIKFLSSVIAQLLPIKFFAYESYIARKADQLRKIEIRALKRLFVAFLWAATISNSLMGFTLLVVIGVYAAVFGRSGAGNTLDVERIFTIYATVQLLSWPLNVLGQFLPDVMAAYASMKRIEKYLLFDEKPQSQSIASDPNSEKHVDSDITLRGSFAWNKEEEPILPNVDITIPTGKLTICTGPVAAGKTSLLIALLGELDATSPPEKTHMPTLEKIGYTSQESFIMPGSLRENILFGSEYDEAWYSKTIKACALEVDFDRMLAGDGTKVTDARSLSGGQKQRIALARAVYSRASLVLLDDPFSALDGETASHVFEHLFGPTGLLRGRTVVLVTHYVHHLPSADWVIILENGSVTHSGTWDEVQQSGYKLSDLSKTIEKSEKSIQKKGEAILEAKKADDGKKIMDETDAVDEVDEESKNPYLRGLKPYKFWFGNAGYLYTVFALTVFIVWPMTRLAMQGYLKEWSDSADAKNYPAWIGGLAGFSFGQVVILSCGFLFYSNHMTPRVGKNIHYQEIRGLLRAPVDWIQRTPAGRIVNRFSQDIFEIDFNFPIAFLNGSSAGFGLIGTMVIIYISSPWLALSAPPMLFAYWILLRFYLKSSKQLQQLEAASKSPLYTVFGTTLAGLENIRAYRAQEFFLHQNDKHLNASQGPYHYRFASLRFLKTALSFMTFIIAVALAGTVVGLRRSTSIAFLGMALSNITNMAMQLSQLLTNWAAIENGTISVARLQEMVELPGERDEEGQIIISKKSDIWPTRGSIVFENVELKYGKDLPTVLNKVSFTIKPGMKVGICGRTGSGKSSTVQALFRAVDSSLVKGKISIDGVDIQSLPRHTLRSSLSIVTQEPFLWHDTIRNNLDVEGTQSDERIWRALDQVGLKKTIQGLSMKLESMIEEAGSFSRGERQLLCLARILLRARKIVVLDEATSSMDLETDDLVRKVVESELKDSTVLAVAHRISTIINFDLILVLENGVVVEADAPAALLASGGRFAQLAASQGIASNQHV